jgi:hypothetical protein
MRKIKILSISLIFFSAAVFGSPRKVLVEMLTNSHCTVCPPAHATLSQYNQTNPNSEKLNYIFYHVSFPYPADPLYQHNTADPTARNSFYGNSSSTPVTFIDGTVQDRTYNQYAGRLDARLAIDSPYEIILSGTKNEGSFKIKADVTQTAEVSQSDLSIFFVVTEDVDYQGNNGVSPQPNVMRKIVPASSGEPYSSSINETKNIEKTIQLNGEWIPEKIKVVVFIQSSGTKEIFQSETIEYNSLSVTSIKNENKLPKSFSLAQNFPNPFNPSTVIEYSIPKEEFVSIKVYNILGKEITTLVNEKKSAGNYEIRFDAGSLPNGVYLYKLIAGNFVETRKMILIK